MVEFKFSPQTSGESFGVEMSSMPGRLVHATNDVPKMFLGSDINEVVGPLANG